VKPPTVTIFQNPDGTWTARIGTAKYRGTEQECIAWLDKELAAVFPDQNMGPS
jgi:hypothetical protein